MTEKDLKKELDALVEAIARGLEMKPQDAALALEQGTLQLDFVQEGGRRLIRASYEGRTVAVGPGRD